MMTPITLAATTLWTAPGPLGRFVAWAAGELGLPVETLPGGGRQAVLPAGTVLLGESGSLGESGLLGESGGDRESPPGTLLAADHPLVTWLADQLRQREPISHAAPPTPVASTGELAARLFAAYQLDSGQVQLAGCTLEDQPLVRVVIRRPEGIVSPQAVVEELYFDIGGTPIAAAYVESLQLADATPWSEASTAKPPKLPPGMLPRLAADVADAARQLHTAAEVLAVTVLWCKYAAGKLRFTFPRSRATETALSSSTDSATAAVEEPLTAELRFADWAALLKPPPFECPHSQHRSFHLTATDDGRIVAAESLATCAQTGRRVLRSELATCAVTGETVLPEFAVACSVTKEPLRRAVAVMCAMCGQPAHPRVIVAGRCTACREIRPVRKDEPRLARVLGEFPYLDRWRWWELAETTAAYVLVGSSLLRKVLVVVDRETLQPQRVALGHRFFSGWALLRPERFRDVLGNANPDD